MTMDVFAETGRGGTQSTAGGLLLPPEPGKFIALPLALGTATAPLSLGRT